jgi:hypothetical protein
MCAGNSNDGRKHVNYGHTSGVMHLLVWINRDIKGSREALQAQ